MYATPDEIAERALIEVSRWQRAAWEVAFAPLVPDDDREPYDTEKVI